ncbi:MAG TPA: stage II sporulation protein M, partial [Candidatus Korarchaeota archaeon]|nr:stage II sporulation protein M [Candidatus Korarchaeota archaeon]
ISLRQAFIRNVVRVADSFFLYLPILSKDGRRLGDGAAGTIVVSERAIKPAFPSLSRCRRILRAPSGFFIQERIMIRVLLSELDRHSEEVDEKTIAKIRALLTSRLRIDAGDLDRFVTETFQIGEDKVNAAMLAAALLTRTIKFKRERARRLAQGIYDRVLEICQDPRIQRTLRAKAKALRTLDRIRSGFRNKLDIRGLFRVYLFVIPNQFRENLNYFLISVLLFMMATFLGYFKLGWLADLFKEAILPAGETIEEISQIGFFIIVFLNNARVSIGMCGGGASVFITIGMLMINGIVVGSFGKAMEGLGKLLIYYSGISPHGFLELSALFMSCASGLRAARSVLFPHPGLSRYESLKRAFDNSFELGFGSIVFLIPAAAIESFITEKLIGDPRYATYVGAGAVSFLYIYLFLAGRKKKNKG